LALFQRFGIQTAKCATPLTGIFFAGDVAGPEASQHGRHGQDGNRSGQSIDWQRIHSRISPGSVSVVCVAPWLECWTRSRGPEVASHPLRRRASKPHAHVKSSQVDTDMRYVRQKVAQLSLPAARDQ